MAQLEDIVLSLIDESRRGDGESQICCDFSNTLLKDLEMPDHVSCCISPNSDPGKGSIFTAFLDYLQNTPENSRLFSRMTLYQNCLQKYFASIVSIIKIEPSIKERTKNVILIQQICEEIYLWSLLCALQRLQDTYDEADLIDEETLKNDKETCLIEWCEFCYRIQELLISNQKEIELPLYGMKTDSLGFFKSDTLFGVKNTSSRIDSDSDLTNRFVKEPHGNDKESEEEFLHNVYKLVRGGQSLQAIDYCIKCNEFWRAAVLEGWLRIISNGFPDGDVTYESWNRTCSLIAIDPNYNIYERKMFAVLSQDYHLLMQFSVNYRDKLWSHYHCSLYRGNKKLPNICADTIFDESLDSKQLFYVAIAKEAYLQPAGKFDLKLIITSIMARLSEFKTLPDVKSHFLRFIIHLTFCTVSNYTSVDFSQLLVLYAIELQSLNETFNAVYYLGLIPENDFDVFFELFLQALQNNPKSISVVTTLIKHINIEKQLFYHASNTLDKEFSQAIVDQDTILRCFQHISWLLCHSTLNIYALALINKIVIFLLVEQQASNQLVIDKIDSIMMLGTVYHEDNDVRRSIRTQFQYILNLMSIYKFIPIWNNKDQADDDLCIKVDEIILKIQELLYENREWISNDETTILGFEKELVLRQFVPLAVNLLAELSIYRKQPSITTEVLYFTINPSSSLIELFSIKERMKLLDCVKKATYMTDIEKLKD